MHMNIIDKYDHNKVNGLTFTSVLKTSKFHLFFFFFFFAFHMNTYNWIAYKIFIYYWFFHFQDLYPWRMLPMCKNCVTGSAIWSITFDCWLWWEWTMFVSVNLHALFIASYWSVMTFERDQCNNTHFLLLLNICNYFSNIFVNDVFRKVMFIVYFFITNWILEHNITKCLWALGI